MTDTSPTPKQVSVDPSAQPDETSITTIPFRPLFKTTQIGETFHLRIPNIRLSEVTTTYWRYFMAQVRCEVRLTFTAVAVRVQVILPTGNRKNFYFRYETKLSFIVSEIMTFANYETGA